jgi:purine-binding chemotaxis protein CheW
MITMVPDFQMATRYPFLRFRLGEENFAVPVSNAINILEMNGIIWTSRSPACMKGFIRLRECILPLVDIRIFFNMEEAPPMAGTCILVLEIHPKKGNGKIGMLVDSIPEFVELSDANIMPPPQNGYLCNPSFIKGTAMVMDEFVMILDVENLLSADDVIGFQKAAGQMQPMVH